MATKKKTTKKKQTSPPIPQSAEAKAARKALIQADLLGIEADRARLARMSRGAYGGAPQLRSSGATMSSYRIGQPKPDKGYGLPPPPPGSKKKKQRQPPAAVKTRRKNTAAQPIGPGKAGSAKRLIYKSGGGQKTLSKFRAYDKPTRKRLVTKARSTKATLTQLIRRRGTST